MNRKTLQISGLFLMVALVWGAGVIAPSFRMIIDGPARMEDGTFYADTLNPVLMEGSRLYGSLGCAECHSQNTNRKTEPPGFWNPRAGYGQSRRLTLPGDYGKDFVAHFGVPGQAPDLSQVRERIERRLTLVDIDNTEKKYASAREWLLLHLYNPRDPAFGGRRSLCPSLPFLFKETNDDQTSPGGKALPVEMPPGKKLVPRRQAEALVSYLLSLDKHVPLPAEAIERGKMFLPQDWESFDLPVRQDETLSAPEVFAREGARVFTTQCSVCHGHDGTGDGYNYPPLAGSQWLELPEEALAEIILRGVKGPLEVNGKKWDNFMTPLGPRLSDRQIAAVVCHILGIFTSKEDSGLTAERVKELREKTKGKKPLSQQELINMLPERSKSND